MMGLGEDVGAGRMIEFRLKADISFMADGIDDALLRLAEHFRRVGTGEDSALVQSGRVLVGRLADARFAAIEAEAVAAHEVVLRERGWMDEYEVETAAAMNFGDGQAAERARIVAGVEATPGVIGHASCIDLTAVLRIIEGETLSD